MGEVIKEAEGMASVLEEPSLYYGDTVYNTEKIASNAKVTLDSKFF